MSKGIFAAVEKAKQAGIPIIAVDTAAEGGVDATVTSNNVQAGEVSCQYIAARLQGKGNVVIINGPPVASVVERVQGCMSVFSKYPDIKILSKDQNAEGSRDGGLRVMSDLLTSFPKIDAVFAINDPSGIGAELAATQAQRKEFFIVVGGNIRAARLTGIKVSQVLLFVYGVSGLLSGLGGIMSASRLYSATGMLGQGYELDAIAAVILGGTSFTGGIGTIWGTLLGALIIALLNNGLTLMNVSFFWQLVVKGLVIIIAVTIDKLRTRSSAA